MGCNFCSQQPQITGLHFPSFLSMGQADESVEGQLLEGTSASSAAPGDARPLS